MRGYQPRRFSFNKPGGRCEACEGNGQKKIEMHFLPDVWVECDVCHGSRYNPETLAVRYKGKTIADVLKCASARRSSCSATSPRFAACCKRWPTSASITCRSARRPRRCPAARPSASSWPPSWRRPNTGQTLYLLDEPTTGLHFDDIRKLLDVLNRLVDLGNTVIVVEHNLDVIKTADWVIDLGPEAGDAGGDVVAAGTPEEVGQAIARLAHGADPAPMSWRPARTPNGRGTIRTPAETPREATMYLWKRSARTRPCPGKPTAGAGTPPTRVTSEGKPCRWEGQILDWIDEQIHALGHVRRHQLEPSHAWSRSPARTKSQGWFFHALTGHGMAASAWCSASATTPSSRTTWSADWASARSTTRPAWKSTATRSASGSTNRKGPWQAVTVLVHRLSEIDTPGVPRVSGGGRRVVPRRT